VTQGAKIIAAFVAGIALGGGAIPGLMAQTAKHPAYVVAELHVNDPAGFTNYVKQLPATLAAYHAKTLVRGLPDPREGAAPEGQVMILAFDSLQDANHWYGSPEHSKLIPLRQAAANTRLYIVDGVTQ
jgi:uncharacterized protein (DUF1330 family)